MQRLRQRDRIIVGWCPAADSSEPTRISFIHRLEMCFYRERCSCNGEGREKKKKEKETPIAHRGTEGLTEKLFVEGWCIHTSTPTSCHTEWREQSDLSLDVAAIFTHGGSCCSNTWFYCDNIMVFQGQCSHWNEILCVGKKKRKRKRKEKKKLKNRRRHRQWRMRIQSCLSRPLRSMWLFFNAFTPAPFFFFFFFSLFLLHLQ